MILSMRRFLMTVRLAVLALLVTASLAATDSRLRDIEYGPEPAQRLDVYRAANPHGAPVLVMVHGGAWMFGDKAARGVVKAKSDHWLPKGYLFVSVGYRFANLVDPVEQARDVGRAVAFVQQHAREWGGDPDRIVLMGHSAGAHLAALLAADASLAREVGARPWLGTVALDTAAYDVSAIMEKPHAAFYDRAFGIDGELWRRASPIRNVVGKPAPILLVCSRLRAESCPASQAFAEALQAAGGRTELLPVRLGHMAINRDLGTDGDYTRSVDKFLDSLGLP